MTVDVVIRPATETDQERIKELVREADLDPTSLHWSHFMLAEADGQVVGIGQIRPYPNCPELGSLYVLPDYQGQGIGGQIIMALLEDRTDTVYLECEKHNVTYYERFGFEEVPVFTVPQPLMIKNILVRMVGYIRGSRLAVMRRDPE